MASRHRAMWGIRHDSLLLEPLGSASIEVATIAEVVALDARSIQLRNVDHLFDPSHAQHKACERLHALLALIVKAVCSRCGFGDHKSLSKPI